MIRLCRSNKQNGYQRQQMNFLNYVKVGKKTVLWTRIVTVQLCSFGRIFLERERIVVRSPGFEPGIISLEG